MKKSKTKAHVWSCCWGGSLCGWFLILIGLWFLAKQLGWISTSFSIWPVIFIIIGIYIITKKKVC